MVGDPSGKMRLVLHLAVKMYCAMRKPIKSKFIKFSIHKKTKIVFNSEWLSKLGTEGMIRLASNYTVARMLERDDFKKNALATTNPLPSMNLFIHYCKATIPLH